MIAVTGANGQLGTELCQQLSVRCLPLDLPAFQLQNPAAAANSIRQLRPTTLIHCAAYTQVDRAESEPELCRQINELSVAALVEACNAVRARFVQISTDYVYCGSANPGRPFTESDPPAPRGVYAQTKFAAEQLAAQAKRHLIVRTCGLYCHTPGGPVRGKNFVDTMLSLAEERREFRVVCDQTCTPSYVPHVVQGILALLEQEAEGLFHLTNAGETTWHQFAEAIFSARNLPVQVRPVSTADYGAKAPRPSYSVLDVCKFTASTGIKLPHWHEALLERLGQLG